MYMYVHIYVYVCTYTYMYITEIIYTYMYICGCSRLREIFLKIDNKLQGQYLAQITIIYIYSAPPLDYIHHEIG